MKQSIDLIDSSRMIKDILKKEVKYENRTNELLLISTALLSTFGLTHLDHYKYIYSDWYYSNVFEPFKNILRYITLSAGSLTLTAAGINGIISNKIKKEHEIFEQAYWKLYSQMLSNNNKPEQNIRLKSLLLKYGSSDNALEKKEILEQVKTDIINREDDSMKLQLK